MHSRMHSEPIRTQNARIRYSNGSEYPRYGELSEQSSARARAQYANYSSKILDVII